MRCYATLINSISYLPGVVALNRSLKRVNTQYPLVVFTSKNFCNEALLEEYLDDCLVREFKAHLSIPEHLLSINTDEGMERWNATFDKLLIFDETEYEKIVFLDADMMICENIDNLFDYPHMSAVKPGYGPDDYNRGLNSGMMVIEPQEGLSAEIYSQGLSCGLPKTVSDNDLLINYYSEWEINEDIHLPDTYNVLFPYIDDYLNGGMEIKTMRIIHFIGKYKPWMVEYEKSAITNHEVEKLLNQYRVDAQL